MRRVVLTHLPGLNFFVGTFDLTNFQRWWKSAPLPGEIENVEHALWVGGPMHLCLAKMMDGTWSIFLSFDYGVHWQLVKNSTVEIMDIELVTFTWVLYSDANGDWWESTNSGLTWTKVCTAGPVGKAFFVLHRGETNIVLSHDGQYITRSTDIARTWSVVCNLNNIYIMADEYHGGLYYTGARVAAIAGANSKVFASNGPYLAESLDHGATWHSSTSWDNCWTGDNQDIVYDFETKTNHSCFPPPRVVEAARNNFLIHDIIVSSTDGPRFEDVTFMLLTKDFYGPQEKRYKRIIVNDISISPRDKPPSEYPSTIQMSFPLYIAGPDNEFLNVDRIDHVEDLTIKRNTFPSTKNESVTVHSYADWVNYKKSIYVKYYVTISPPLTRVFKTFSGRARDGRVYENLWIKFVYQQAASEGMNLLSSYHLMVPGGNAWDKLVFSAMRTTDADGNPKISLKYSTDGGLTFNDINIDEIAIYTGNVDEEPSTEGDIYNLFKYIDYSNLVWVTGICNNHPFWDYESGDAFMMLSYDIDMIVSNIRNRSYGISGRIIHPRSRSYTMDAIYPSPYNTEYGINTCVQKIWRTPYLIDARLQKKMSEEYNLDAPRFSYPKGMPYDLHCYIQKLVRDNYYLAAYIQGPKSKFYNLSAIITDSQADEMGVALERRFPQAWNVIFKPLPKPIYDSRKDPETN